MNSKKGDGHAGLGKLPGRRRGNCEKRALQRGGLVDRTATPEEQLSEINQVWGGYLPEILEIGREW